MMRGPVFLTLVSVLALAMPARAGLHVGFAVGALLPDAEYETWEFGADESTSNDVEAEFAVEALWRAEVGSVALRVGYHDRVWQSSYTTRSESRTTWSETRSHARQLLVGPSWDFRRGHGIAFEFAPSVGLGIAYLTRAGGLGTMDFYATFGIDLTTLVRLDDATSAVLALRGSVLPDDESGPPRGRMIGVRIGLRRAL